MIDSKLTFFVFLLFRFQTYLTGESYAGQYIPYFGELLL